MKYSYIPLNQALNSIPHIMVDSAGVPATVLELSHWPNNKTPEFLKDDTSTQIVFRFLEQKQLQPDTRFVTNDHYDIDGLLSVWVMLFPELAFKHRNHIEAISFTGDFDFFLTEESAKSCLAFDYIERELANKINTPQSTTDSFTTDLISDLLEYTEDCIINPVKFKDLWQEEYNHVQRSLDFIGSDRLRVQKRPDLGIAIIDSNAPIHRYVLNYLADESLVIYAIHGKFQEMYYRYESFVDFISAKFFPRVEWSDFVTNLNQNTKEGEWMMESAYSAHPSLRYYKRGVGACPPEISSEQFIEMAIAHLQKNKDKHIETKVWTQIQKDVLPPSYRSKSK